MEAQHIHEEDEVLLMENGDSFFQFQQQKTVVSSNNSSRFQSHKGLMPSNNNWESQNRGPYQPFNNGRSLNKENVRSRSRSQGRDHSEHNQRRPYRNNNERFENRQHGHNRYNDSGFNQGQRDHSRPRSPQGNHQGNHRGYQNNRFNNNGRDNRDNRDNRNERNDRNDRNDRNEGRIFKPTLEGHLKSFRQFMESQRNDVDPSQAEKVYNQYKQEYEEKQDKIFFAEHRNDEWFKEKYDKFLAEKFLEEKREESRMNADRFIANLNEGVYDGLNLDYEEYEHKHLLNEQTSGQNEEDKDDNGFTEVGIDNDHDITSAPFFGYNPGSQTLFIKSIPKFISRWDLTQALQKLDGYLSLSMSEPLKSQDFNRLGWILFDNETNCNIACEHLKTLNIKGHAFAIFKAKFQQKTLKICENMNEEAVNAHLQLSRQLIEALDSEKDIRTGELVKYDHDVDPARQLDLQILYLRKVHSYCFYCAAEFTDERILASKCGPIHLRRQKLGKETPRPDLPDWHKRLANLINQRIQESFQRPRLSQEDIEREAEKEFDEYLRTLCQNLSKQGNWPCKFCPKIFKEDHFVIKHVKTKHPEEAQKLKEKKMCESFRNDKNKINPTFNGGNQSQANGSRPQGQSGFRPQNNNYRQDRNREYKDLDDPKVSQVRTSRPVISYDDL